MHNNKNRRRLWRVSLAVIVVCGIAGPAFGTELYARAIGEPPARPAPPPPAKKPPAPAPKTPAPAPAPAPEEPVAKQDTPPSDGVSSRTILIGAGVAAALAALAGGGGGGGGGGGTTPNH